MKVDTSSLQPNKLSHMEQYQVYNGLDCMLTFEIFEVLSKQLSEQNDPSARLIYDFERGMQAPALDMMLRGFLTDRHEVNKSLKFLGERLEKCQRILDRYGYTVWRKPLNANSPKQLKTLFYEKMGLPEQFIYDKGVRRVSTNRESLEKLLAYFYAVPIINAIFSIRDLRKKISVLSTEISPDSRMRTAYNVAGTTTGRWTSSSDAFGEGNNLQNITSELRRVFIADPGKKLLHIDLEQAESRVVGLLVWALMGDETYIRACESGDLHTSVAKLLWSEIDSRESAELPFYRHFTFRDMSKRGGHATNYLVTPFTMSRHLKVPISVCEEFQRRYYHAFSGIRKWQNYTASEIQLHQELTTPLGRRRIFFGSPYADTTIREAVAFVPQSTVADLVRLIMWKILSSGLPVELLTDDHDGLTMQYRDDPSIETSLISSILSLTKIPLTLNQSSILIPAEPSIGWNWATGEKPPFFKDGKSLNPNGLMKWRGRPDGRKRLEGLDRVIS